VLDRRARRWIYLATATAVFFVLVANTGGSQAAFHFLCPGEPTVIHPRASLLVLVWEHIQLVAVSSGITVLVGVPLGIWVTRPSGHDFLPIVTDITSFGQTFPPVAVLALAVPALGFGLLPTVVALFLYGLLPVVRNTVAGLRAVPASLVDTAYGIGMGPVRTLFRVELPLSAQVILAGVRISVIINIGTAMIGAVIGAGGLGSPIVAGLVRNNLAFILEGAIPAAMLAILADQLLGNIETGFAYAPART
jgi:osmoprotectant transport system permease protein